MIRTCLFDSITRISFSLVCWSLPYSVAITANIFNLKSLVHSPRIHFAKHSLPNQLSPISQFQIFSLYFFVKPAVPRTLNSANKRKLFLLQVCISFGFGSSHWWVAQIKIRLIRANRPFSVLRWDSHHESSMESYRLALNHLDIFNLKIWKNKAQRHFIAFP